MKRSTRAFIAACALVVAAPAIQPSLAQATSVDQAKAEVDRIVDELDRLEEQSDKLAEDYVVAIDDKNQLDAEIVEAEKNVAAKEAELSELQGNLAEVAVRAFSGSGTDVLGPLFSSATVYNDALQRDQYSRVALDVGTASTDDLDQVIEDLADARADLEAKLARAEELTVDIAAKQTATEDLRAQYITKRAEAESRLGEAIAAEEQRRAEAAYQKLLAEQQAEQDAAAASANSSSANSEFRRRQLGWRQLGWRQLRWWQLRWRDSVGGSVAAAPAPATGGGGGGGGGGSAPPASSVASIAVNAAMGQIGVPYRYATSSPGVNFDCSGLTKYAWGVAGVSLPHQSRAQAAMLPSVSAANAQPGDLIFYYSPISHVGVYLGGGSLVHAPNTGSHVKTSGVNWGKVTAIGRPG